MENTVIKTEPLLSVKREHPAGEARLRPIQPNYSDDPSFVEEELQIFTKRPKLVSRRKGNFLFVRIT